MKTTIKDKCPMCLVPLVMQPGNQVNPTHGFLVECPNITCGMTDWGWGRTVKEAVNIFGQKCSKPVTK